MAEHSIPIEFGVKGYEKFGDVARVIGRVERNFPKWIQKEIDKEARKLQREARKSIQGQRGESKKQTGILNVIAGGIGTEKISDDSGDGMRITTSMPEENERYLPRGFDTSWGGFNHPIFYQPDRVKADGSPSWFAEKHWTHQDGRYAWWVQVMEKAEPDLEPKMEAILERGAEEISKSAHEKD